MKITLAKSAGFCYGVNRAVQMVYDLLEAGERVCTLGPIIHNPQLVKELEAKGVRTVEDCRDVRGEEVLVIRSHGVGKDVYRSASQAGIRIEDATCPFVAKIHSIVEKAGLDGKTVLIAGDPQHQEVRGIIGHCTGPYYVAADEAQLRQILQNHPDLAFLPVILVSQTTFHAQNWTKYQNFLKKVCTNAEIFDTICNATSKRQEEAAALAACHEAMVVIGGRRSSNTAKLYEICRSACGKTCHVETAKELDLSFFGGCGSVGVVAGASTPAGIIKEVLRTMSENLQPVEEQAEVKEPVQKSFDEMTDEEAFEASLSSLTSDQKVRGTVVAVNDSEITVDIGRGLTGYVTAAEFSQDPEVKLTDEVKVDDVLDLIIMKINDQEGTAMLSKRRYDAIAGWDKIVAAKESEEVLTGVVKDIVKGGVVTYSNSVRVFIPASQATASRNDPIEDLKGKEVSFRIIEIGRGRRVIGSIRSVLRDERKAAAEKLWATIAEGDRFTGVVKSLTSFGAFVDIGGVDGMIHISELSWQRIKNPSEVVSVGDTVEVYVKAVDTEKKKISLGYKKDEDNPWFIFQRDFEVGDVVKVTIVSMTTYGAFARIIPGIDGLIHISQIANKRIEKPQDELEVGQEVDVKITAIDPENKRVSLSIRALLQTEAAPVEEVAPESGDEVVYEVTGESAPAESEQANLPAVEETAEQVAPPVEEEKAEESTPEAEAAQPAAQEETAAEDAAPAEESAQPSEE